NAGEARFLEYRRSNGCDRADEPAHVGTKPITKELRAMADDELLKTVTTILEVVDEIHPNGMDWVAMQRTLDKILGALQENNRLLTGIALEVETMASMGPRTP